MTGELSARRLSQKFERFSLFKPQTFDHAIWPAIVYVLKLMTSPARRLPLVRLVFGTMRA